MSPNKHVLPYEVRAVRTPEDLDLVKRLFACYETFLAISLSFQNFDQEKQSLPGRYRPEEKGELYIVYFQQQPVGCAAYYELEAGIAEIKRMYIDTEFQGQGLGKALINRMLADCKNHGYRFVRLDSLKRLHAARRLYLGLGFYEIDPFNDNPLEDVYYMEMDLALWQPK